MNSAVADEAGKPTLRARLESKAMGKRAAAPAPRKHKCMASSRPRRPARPVQLVYPREEDFTHDQYRPVAAVQVRAALDSGQGYETSLAMPYTFGARRLEWVRHPWPISVGFWRSVGASINTFALASAINELAQMAGQDAMQFAARA